MQRIASFDIGEKNFAYVVCTKTETALKIERLINHNVMMKKKQTIPESCTFLSLILKQEHLFQTCTKILVEQQLLKNIRTQRLAQHVWSWFTITLPDVDIVMVPSSLKTQFFLGKNKLTSTTRKQWAIEKVWVFFTDPESKVDVDVSTLEYFKSLEKKDDVSDALLQTIAYLKL